MGKGKQPERMIDTVILSIPKDKTQMIDMSAHGVAGWDLQSKTTAYKKFVKNPSLKDMESGLYFPRLTGYKRKAGKYEWDATIKIEFSAPKLIYQNNIDELSNEQFGAVVGALQDRLARMGIGVAVADLELADVMAVHYSKNVLLTGGFTSQYVIGELNKINLNKRFDMTRARYINDGQSLYAYTEMHSLVVYDKIADLTRGKKRSIDREQTPYQLSLFTPPAKKPEPLEIIRFEVRLSKKRKLNSLFPKLGFAEKPSFKDVFTSEKSEKILMYYWDTMLNGNMSMLFAHSFTSKELLKHILLTDRKMKAKEAVYLTGLVTLLQDGNGARELRTALAKHTDNRTWYRMASDARDIGAAFSKLKPRDWHAQVQRALKSYKPFHTADLSCKEL